MLRKFFIFSLGLLFSLQGTAQKFNLHETEEFKSPGSRHAYPFILQDGNYTVIYGSLTYLLMDPIYSHSQALRFLDESYLVKFNKDYKKISETPLTELNGLTKAEGFVSNGKKILVLTGTDKGSLVNISELDPVSGKLVGSTKLLSGLPKKHPLLHSASDNGHLFAICTPLEVGKKENQSFQVGIFDENAKVKANYTITINCPQNELDDQYFLLNNYGELFCIFFSKGRYRVASYTDAGKTKGEISIGTGAGYEMFFDFRLVNSNIQYQGIKGESSKKDITSFLAGAIDQGTMKSVWLKETAFSSLTFNNDELGNSYKNFFKNGISNKLDFIESRSLSDGSRISILEMNFQWTKQSYHNNDLSKASYSMKKYQRGDLIIVNQDSVGQVNWVRAISKRQEQIDINTYLSFASAVDEKDGLSIFFHDDADNHDVFTDGRVKQTYIVRNIDKYSLAGIYVTKTGQVKKSFIVDNGTRETYMVPRGSSFVVNGSLFCFAIRIAGFKGVFSRMGIMKITPQ